MKAEVKDMITAYNVADFQSTILVATTGNEKLREGLRYTMANIDAYESDEFVRDMIEGFLTNLNVYLAKNAYFQKKYAAHQDGGYSGRQFKGSLYEATRDLSTKEIAELVRIEVKASFPDWNISITYDSFVGGSAIRMRIKSVPYNPYNEDISEVFRTNGDEVKYYNERRYENKYNEQFRKDEKTLKRIVNQYNRDDSDAMTDYFDVRFYDTISVEEVEIKAVYFPENIKNNEHIQWSKDYDEKAKLRNAKAREKKGKFPKGSEAIYTPRYATPNIPIAEYKAEITKSPNGRARGIPQYSIIFEVPRGEKIVRYRANVWESELKAK